MLQEVEFSRQEAEALIQRGFARFSLLLSDGSELDDTTRHNVALAQKRNREHMGKLLASFVDARKPPPESAKLSMKFNTCAGQPVTAPWSS